MASVCARLPFNAKIFRRATTSPFFTPLGRHIFTDTARRHDDHHHDAASHKLYAQHLTHRGLVAVSGADASNFLQGLITSDMACFNHPDCASLYAGFLSAQGRLLYDIILYNMTNGTYWAECDVSVVDDLVNAFKRHKLRKKLNIEDMSDGIKIWSIFRPNCDAETTVKPEFIDQKFNLAFSPDPRLKSFGWRLLLPEHSRMENTVSNAYEVHDDDGDIYKIERYKLGIAEGTSELTPNKCFPLESNFAFLNGVSFTKGCYIGQELTARTFHVGVTRKRLMPITFGDCTPNEGASVLDVTGKTVGTIRAALQQHGLAMIRIGNLTSKEVTVVDGDKTSVATVHVPKWWPLGHDEFKKVGFSLT